MLFVNFPQLAVIARRPQIPAMPIATKLCRVVIRALPRHAGQYALACALCLIDFLG
jgi:hypothetical protein